MFKRAFSKFFNPKFYTLLRLIALTAFKKKNKSGTIRIGGFKIEYNDIRALMGMYHEIIYQEHYRFATKSEKPVIIDCGANIGLSVLYFHRTHPKAQIIAIEADPAVAAVLRRNLEANGCSATVIEKAAWSNSDSEITFGQAGADSGSIFSTENVIRVPTVRFKDIIEEYPSIDLIKIDIEGAEMEVIEDCYSSLGRSKYVFIEFHSFPQREQRLERILELLASQGFRYKVLQARREEKPFMQDISNQEMDVQLNVFFHKN